MNEYQLTLTAEEHDALASFLETALKEARVEEHRTRAPSFREHIIHREELFNSLLKKLGKAPA